MEKKLTEEQKRIIIQQRAAEVVNMKRSCADKGIAWEDVLKKVESIEEDTK